MSDTQNGFEPITLNNAVDSLLNALPTDKATDGENVEAEASAPLETEFEAVNEDNPEEGSEDIVEEEVVEDADDEEDEYPEEEEEAPQSELYSVKIDGEEYEVTFDELQKGYQTNRSLTKRGMDLAEQRKAFEQEAAQVKQMRDVYAQQLEQVQGQLQQAIPEQEPDWAALAKEYPAEDLIVYKAQLDQQKEQARHVEAERQRIQQEQAQEQQVFRQKHLESQRGEMLNRIPSWSNEDTRNNERQEVIKYAQSRGFSQEEVSQASDARAIELLYKAWQWDNLQKKTPAAKKKVKSAPKMAKAGQPKSKAQVASRQRKQGLDRLNKERSVDAAVSYLMGN